MSYSENTIYQINEYQLTNLMIAANSEIPGFAVIQANETDDEEIKEKLSRYQKDVADLVALGLVEDISEEFPKEITETGEKFERKLKVYAVTEIGFLLFHNYGDRPAQ
jgi:hypothetical protein